MKLDSGCGCNDRTGGFANSALGGMAAGGESELLQSAIDLSRPVWKVGQATKSSDLLWALPFVKGQPLTGVTVGAANQLAVFVQRAGEALLDPTYYGITTAIADVSTATTSSDAFSVQRIGGRVRVLTIDQYSTALGTAQSYATDQLQVAATTVLRFLDNQVIAGSGPSSSQMAGLSFLATSYSRTASEANPDKAARILIGEVLCNGSGGTGEGLDCMFAGIRTIQTLMTTTAGQSGTSGWRRDPRTGRSVYFYQGIPVYRVDSKDTDTGTLWGANLGATGLCIVHAFGSAEGFGLVAEELPVTTISGTKDILLHGAWALVAWEKTALFEVTGITLSI